MKPRPYQTECLAAIRRHLAQVKSTLAVLATGLGKTVIFSHLVADWPGRCLILAHREELIYQAAEKVQAITGEAPAIEMGAAESVENGLRRSRVIVSSVQTMCRPGRQAKFRPGDFGLVVVDEAHHATAKTYTDVLAYFRQSPNVHVLGVTATPKRGDALALGGVFETCAFEYGIEQAIDDGWLVPVRQQSIMVEGLDFSKVRTVCHDFSAAELEAIIISEEILHKTIAPAVELIGKMPALFFAVSVGHAHALAEVTKRYRPASDPIALDGKTDRSERADRVTDFKSGKSQFLFNCGLFLEGFDAPNTAAVVMARPTKSLALYTQVLGRGTRPLPGVVDGLATAEERKRAIAASAKPFMLCLDFVGNSGKHKIVTAADVLGGKYPEEVRERAAKLTQSKALPVGDALKEAAEDLALLQEEKELIAQEQEEKRKEELEAQRKAFRDRIRAEASFVAEEVSPFYHDGGNDRPEANYMAQVEPATPRQVWYLVHRAKWNQHAAERLSKRQASAVISKHKAAEAEKEGNRDAE